MFIYTITTKVDHAILDKWLQWQKEIHIPEIMTKGLFYEHRFYQLLEQDETEGKTFVIQFLATARSDYYRYLQVSAGGLRKKTTEKWGDQVICFQSLLKEIS